MEKSNSKDIKKSEGIKTFSLSEDFILRVNKSDVTALNNNSIKYGSFSETTTASFSADFYTGSTDGATTEAATNEAIASVYSFEISLSTSFTGEDSLDVAIEAGNTTGDVGEFDANTTDDTLTVDGITYTFPVGGATTMVGDNTDISTYTTGACDYSAFTDYMGDCGTGSSIGHGATGATAAISYAFDSGFTLAGGIAGSSDTQTDITGEGDTYGINSAYTTDNYGVSVTYSDSDTKEGDTYSAINAYYTPDDLPSVSVGYTIGDTGGTAATADEKTSFFVGLNWDEVGPGSASIAAGHSSTVEGSDEFYVYETYYSYAVNDGMTITPAVFIKENTSAGTNDTTGVMVKTSFSF